VVEKRASLAKIENCSARAVRSSFTRDSSLG
jgi:hypothetical protein